MIPSLQFLGRRVNMNTPAKRKTLKWIVAALSLSLVIGCSTANSQSEKPPIQPDSAAQTPPSSTAPQTSDTARELLLNMKQLAEQGKVINSTFPVKATVIEEVKSRWGEPDKTDWVAAAKGTYATYSKHAVVFGFNKGSRIFEVRSFDKQLKQLSLSKTKEVYGTPAYDVKVNGEEIIGYTAGPEFKIEFVFPRLTASNSDPVMDHYLVLHPAGTVNSMADDPGRQW
ncbi:YjgB family protein [Desulfosporosinus sp.]|uniref:YjgB family protein n=1 Tax=Desulfosporosinus sp. TaxID=157907 RepID=UPI0023215E1B|nr:YjgB family protein [Desulfosporosinus sp.]MDA8222003.1 YjgB family protein [Desulfitobacterium hafniense]